MRSLLPSLGFLLLVHVCTGSARAQGCCTAGASTLGGVESGILPYRTLSIGINYQYNSLTRAHLDRNRIDDPLRRTAGVGYFTLHAEYGLQPRLSLFASAVYADKTREITIISTAGGTRFTETVSFSGSGIGDLLLLAKYQLVAPTITSPVEFGIGGGASLPTGSFTKEQQGSQLSLDLQPGTGAAALIGWVFAMHTLPETGLRFHLSASYRYSGTNFDGYRIGDELITNLAAEYTITERLGMVVILRSRYAAQDFASRRVLTATGGTYHDLMPALTYQDGPSSARVFGQVPLYRNVRGIQLTVTYLLGLEYRYLFDFRDLVDVIIPRL